MDPSAAHVHLRLSSRAENVPVVRQALNGMAAVTGLSAADLNDIETAVTEACNNVSIHAYRDGEGPLEVEMLVRDETVVVTVRDRGVGVPFDATSQADFPTDAEGELAGLGMPSIKALAASARWSEPVGGGTEVQMTFATGRLAFEGAAGTTLDVAIDGRSPTDGVEVRMAPLSVARTVLPRLLGAVAAQAHFSIDRHTHAQRVGNEVLRAGPESWTREGLDAHLTRAGDSLEVSVGPASDEEAAQILSAVRELQPDLQAGAEPPDDGPGRLVLYL